MFQFLRTPPAQSLTFEDIANGLKKGSHLLVDVRDHSEVAMSGKAAGATHVPLFQLATHADPSHPDYKSDFSKDKTIVLYCASGARSQAAIQSLSRLGYSDLHNLGGLQNWLRAGGAVEHA